MALNIKTLGTRALTALVFVVLLLSCLLWNYYSFTVFFFVVALLGLQEFYKLSENLQAKPYKILGTLSAVCLYFSFIKSEYLNIPLMAFDLRAVFLTLIPFVILLAALFDKGQAPIQNALHTLLAIIYAVFPFALIHILVTPFGTEHDTAYFEPKLLLGVILLIWGNDTFAYLGGSLFGKHKMIERISPGKTWEGTITGIVLSFAASFLFEDLLLKTNTSLWPVLGILVPVLATFGDLVESLLKRQAGVKDTGNLMPGHGGILDRFDSLIFVSPFVFVILKLL